MNINRRNYSIFFLTNRKGLKKMGILWVAFVINITSGEGSSMQFTIGSILFFMCRNQVNV